MLKRIKDVIAACWERIDGDKNGRQARALVQGSMVPTLRNSSNRSIAIQYRGPFNAFKPFIRCAPFTMGIGSVPMVPAVPPLRSVQVVKHTEPFQGSRFKSSRTDSCGELPRFGNSRNVEKCLRIIRYDQAAVY